MGCPQKHSLDFSCSRAPIVTGNGRGESWNCDSPVDAFIIESLSCMGGSLMIPNANLLPFSLQVAKPRCRSVSVGEQWLQQNRLQPMSASPSRTHCSFRWDIGRLWPWYSVGFSHPSSLVCSVDRKGRGEAKKCRKVYGVERKDQWCTACRWKKACQRFPD